MAGQPGILANWSLPGVRGKIAALFGGAIFGTRRPRAEAAVPKPWLASYPPDVAWDAEIETGPLFQVLDDAVAQWPANRCLEFLGKSYTYAEVGDAVARLAGSLAAQGVGKGTRVGMFLPNCPYYVLMYFAVLKTGATLVNFNPLYAEREIARQISDSGCTWMVTLNLKSLYPKIAKQLDTTCLERIIVCSMSSALPLPGKALFAVLKRKELATVPSDEQHVWFDKLAGGKEAAPEVSIDPARDIALLQYTGGTTGEPKGAMLSHGALFANAHQTRMWAADLAPGEERVLAVLPFFHVFGMTGVMNTALRSGAELIILPRFNVGDVLKAISKQRPTSLMGVPTMYSALNKSKDLDKHDLSSLRLCISGGAALSGKIRDQFEALSGCTLVEGYGLSEAAPVCTINPFATGGKIGSIGLPVPGTTVEIVDLADPDRVLPIGDKGEICIRGPQVMLGYWRRAAESREALRGGRLHTGDVGYIDSDGYVTIIDRIKDLIINSGFNVYPRMVEEAILLHDEVAEVAVVGVADPHRGEAVKAFVVRTPGSELKGGQLRAFLRDKLAAFEQPRRIEMCDELPLTLMGKPSRRELVARELARQAAGQDADDVVEDETGDSATAAAPMEREPETTA